MTVSPNTPLHDGAVIIKDFKIMTAASYLPLSESPAIPKKLGTRHRAAIGLSEATDAITLIVSVLRINQLQLDVLCPIF